MVISGTTGIDAGSLPVSNCGNTEVEGNLNLSGVGTRITGDFSNATVTNRVMFQTSTVNGNTIVGVIPNGTGANGQFRAINSSNDPANSSWIAIQAATTESQVLADKSGTGSYLPMTLYTGGSERMRIDTAGNVGIGTSSPAYKLDINNAISRIGDSSGIGFLQFGSSATASSNYHIGDNAGNFIFYQGNYGSGTERMRIDSAGRVTMPYQPGFKAFGSVGALTGSGSVLPYGNTSVPHNVGGGFNSTNSRFTAPVSGFYHFSWQFWAPPNQAGTTQFYVNGGFISRHGREGVEGYYEGVTCSTEVYLNSGDYVYIGVFSGEVHLGVNLSYFSGFLIG